MEPSTLVLIIGIPVGIILILYGLFDTKKRRDTPDLVTEFNDDPTTDTFDHGDSDAQRFDPTSVETVPANPPPADASTMETPAPVSTEPASTEQASTEQASTEQASSGVEPPSVGNGGSADSATPQNG